MMYVSGKNKENAQRDNYLFDCLWAMATEMRFHKNIGTEKEPEYEPTYPRWHELVNKKPVEKKPKITKEMIKARFKRLIE